MLRSFRLARVVCLAVVFAPASASAAVKWKAIDRAELAATAPVVQKDADAEAIFWEVRVADELSMFEGVPRTVLTHYLRIKIFTERGRDAQSNVEIPHAADVVISDVLARTIKADGSIVEIKKADVFERTLVKAGGLRLKATTFVVPGVEVGSIIEYQWQELRLNTMAMFAHLECQRDVPVQLVRYLIKPLSVPGFDYGMRVEAFNGQNTAFVEDKEERGFIATTMARVPAFKSEGQMPPDHDVKPWLLLYYTPGGRPRDPVRFWKEFGASLHDVVKSTWKADGAIKIAAQTAAGKATTVAGKIDALLALCRTIRRTDLIDSVGLADAKKKSERSPPQTLSRREGDADDVLALFGALALAAGLEAHLAMIPDRDEMAHPPDVAHAYFMSSRAVAVRDGTAWRFANPINAYGTAGALAAGQEGRRAIVSDPKETLFVVTDVSQPSVSRRRRTVRIKVDANGGAEGDLTFTYSGHIAYEVRLGERAVTAEEREKGTREFIASRLPGAEVTNIRYEHLNDQDGELSISAHVKLADFAQRTASRLFLAPALFQQKAPPMFTASERRHAVSFSYAWTDEDRVTIELPDGYRPEFTAPDGIRVPEVAAYSATLQQLNDRTIQYQRDMFFGAGARLEFPVAAYTAVKAFFDRVQELDRYTVTLRQAAQEPR